MPINPFLIVAIFFFVVTLFCIWVLYSISKTIRVQRRYDGHGHAKVLKVCKKEHLPPAVVKSAGVGSLASVANPGNEYALLAFDPEARVHIETTTSFGMPTGFFSGVESVEIQYDLNNPSWVYLCDERPILAKQKFFQIMSIVFGIAAAFGLLLGL